MQDRKRLNVESHEGLRLGLQHACVQRHKWPQSKLLPHTYVYVRSVVFWAKSDYRSPLGGNCFLSSRRSTRICTFTHVSPQHAAAYIPLGSSRQMGRGKKRRGKKGERVEKARRKTLTGCFVAEWALNSCSNCYSISGGFSCVYNVSLQFHPLLM